jgi:hypothetical protein
MRRGLISKHMDAAELCMALACELQAAWLALHAQPQFKPPATATLLSLPPRSTGHRS